MACFEEELSAIIASCQVAVGPLLVLFSVPGLGPRMDPKMDPKMDSKMDRRGTHSEGTLGSQRDSS